MADLKKLVEGLKPTEKVYLADAYLRECQASVVRVAVEKGRKGYLVLDKTLFHPRGGGQPSDTGAISSGSSVFEVRRAMELRGVIVHWGRFRGEPTREGELVRCVLNWDTRYLVMRLHTAGHILDYGVATVYGRTVETLSAHHGPPRAYTEYAAPPPGPGQLSRIEEIANRIVEDNRRVYAVIVPQSRLSEAAFNAPNLSRLPSVEEYRVVIIEGVNGIPCTGTHVKQTGEVGRIAVEGAEPTEGGFRLYYRVEPV